MRKLIVLIFVFCIPVFLYAVSFQQDNSIIRGIVTDHEGKPLNGATITIENTFLGVQSDLNGTYSFRGLKHGSYTLKFSYIGYETEIKDVKLEREAVLDVSLSPASFMTEEVHINATRAGENTPLAYSVIDKSVLKKYNTGHDMPYLMSLTPSLVETSEAGNGIGYTGLRIRGTDANRINVTLDGIPLNDAESHTVFWVDLPDLASSIESIQIQRGVGTSSNGAGAFGATVSIQTLNPEIEPLAEVNSSFGSFNTIKNTISAGTGMLGGKFAMQMRYSDLRSDGYVERTGSKHRSAFVSGVYRTEKSRLKANIILGEEHTGIGWWGVPQDSLSTNRKYNPSGSYTDESGNIQYYNNESDNYNQNHFQLIYSLKTGEYTIFNTALHYTMGKGYYEEYREDQELEEYGLESFSIGGQEITSTDMIRRKWLSNDFYGLVYSLKYNRSRVEATAGGGINLYNGDHYGNIIWMRNAGNTEKDHRWYFNNSLKSEFNIYGKVNYSASEKATIFGDLQYRYIYYDMSGIDNDTMDISQLHKYGFFNPKAGLFYAITPDMDAYISFSVANREPTRSDFKEASGDPDATPRPETLYDTEMGYKFRTGKGSLAVNLYGMYYRDQLVPTGELSDVGYTIMTNVDRSYRLGIEFSGAARINDNIEWNVNYTVSRNKILDFVEHYVDYNTSDWTSEYLGKEIGEVDIAYSPAHVWTSDLTFRLTPAIGMHLITKYVGKQYFDNTMSPERLIDPYFINNFRIDISPKTRILKGIDLQIMVNNFLNEVYENNAYGGNWYEDGNEKTWAYYFPQAGINYMLRLGVKF